MFSCKICKISKNTSGGCFWTNTGSICGLLCGEEIFWPFSTRLPWLTNIMLDWLTESSFDISLLFKLKYRAILGLSYNDLLCLHEYTKMIGLRRKRQFFGVKKLKWFLLFSGIDIQESVSKQNFYACARTEKRDVVMTFCLHSV